MRMRSPVATAVAMGSGLIILLGYFLPGIITDSEFSLGIARLRDILVGWAVILAGFAGIVAIVNLIMVHFRRASAPRGRDLYSLVLIAAFFGTLLAGLILNPSDIRFQRMVTAVQEPMEISLLALLAVTLAYACLRLLNRRKGLMSIVFIGSAIVFLLLATGVLTNVPGISGLVGLINRLPVAGARGILLGIALGSLTTGLRIIMGTERPYSG